MNLENSRFQLVWVRLALSGCLLRGRTAAACEAGRAV